jgi:hypothetical protein
MNLFLGQVLRLMNWPFYISLYFFLLHPHINIILIYFARLHVPKGFPDSGRGVKPSRERTSRNSKDYRFLFFLFVSHFDQSSSSFY